MSSQDRSKKRIQLWKKAVLHFALCFVTGFFTGFAPPSAANLFSVGGVERPPVVVVVPAAPFEGAGQVVEPAGSTANRSLSEISRSMPVPADNDVDPPPPHEGAGARGARAVAPPPRERLLILVTTTRRDDRFQGAFLRRLANTLRLVPPPLLWIVVQASEDAGATAAMLRNTGVMYRHLTFKENFTDPEAEVDHQRNVALSHVECHRLTGIIHFASASNVYDVQFFEEIRHIEVFGTWPVAMVSTNRKRVVVDGPVCNSSKVLGWILKELNNDNKLLLSSTDRSHKPPKINISGFAFNSSILWEPERWGRPTSLPDTSQDSIKFVHEVILEDETKLKGIPADCSRIMVWHLNMPSVLTLPFHSQNQGRR